MLKRKIERTIRVSKYVIYRETLVDYKENIWAFISAFVGIGLIALTQSFFLTKAESIFLIGSFGASSVLIYGAIQSPLSQPRNLIGGHILSALVGVTVYKIFPDVIWFTAPLAVSFSIVLMQVTKTLHPPGGATALIAIIGSDKIKDLGYLYVLSPVLTGTLILFFIGLIFNNITKNRAYPTNRTFTRFLKKKRR
ncbi:HPP family protein [Algibacter sp. PT7-4]|uniref:HPP family protein n=1 Tax=Algibacter ulvanivorans TaxID=3400999 RepID=UPI003AADCB92